MPDEPTLDSNDGFDHARADVLAAVIRGLLHLEFFPIGLSKKQLEAMETTPEQLVHLTEGFITIVETMKRVHATISTVRDVMDREMKRHGALEEASNE